MSKHSKGGRPRKPIRTEPKRCNLCKVVKPIEEFYFNLNANGRKYPNSRCGECSNKLSKAKYATGQGRTTIKSNAMKRKYGITQEEYDAMFAAQGGLCAICGKPETAIRTAPLLAIDHCHATGKVRSLLCVCCNAGIGLFGDSAERLQAAISYLLRHRA